MAKLSATEKRKAQEAKRAGQASFTGDDGTSILLSTLASTDFGLSDSSIHTTQHDSGTGYDAGSSTDTSSDPGGSFSAD